MYVYKMQEIYQHIAKYAKPDNLQATFILIHTLVIYFILVFFSYVSFENYYFIILIILTSLTRLRLFIIFHDMAHHAFFSSPLANRITATLLGTFVHTPYSGWKKGHDYHHEHSNNTDYKQYAQTAPLTISQYKKLSRYMQNIYNFIYGHYTLTTTTPLIYFMIIQRFMSRWYENLLIFIYWYFIITCGKKMIYIEFISTGITAAIGTFLFHIQHTFEGAYRASKATYSRFDNSMYGTSYLIIPWYLKWFTASIEYHNIHHLNSRVPLYKLRQCFEDGAQMFTHVPTFTIYDAIKRLPYSLRHDDHNTFVSCYDDLSKY